MSQHFEEMYRDLVVELRAAYPQKKVISKTVDDPGNDTWYVSIKDDFGEILLVIGFGEVIFQQKLEGFKYDLPEVEDIFTGELDGTDPYEWIINEIDQDLASNMNIRPASNIIDRHSNYLLTHAIREKANRMLAAWPEPSK